MKVGLWYPRGHCAAADRLYWKMMTTLGGSSVRSLDQVTTHMGTTGVQSRSQELGNKL
jgi:hypothetical protein